MNDNLIWIPHDADMGNHPKCKALIAAYGYEGYGRFHRLNEMIGCAEGCRLDLRKRVYFNQTAGELRMTPDEFQEFIDFLSDVDECGLLQVVDNCLITKRTQESLKSVRVSREAARNRQKRYKQRGNAEETPNDGEESAGNASFTRDQGTEHSIAQHSRAENNACMAVSPNDVQKMLKGTALTLKAGYLERWASELTAHALPPEFASWLYTELQARPKVRNPAAMCRTLLDNLDDAEDEIRSYREQQEAADPDPPSECPNCHSRNVSRHNARQYECDDCRHMWAFVQGTWKTIHRGKPPASDWADDDYEPAASG